MVNVFDEDNLVKTFMPEVLKRHRMAAGLSQQKLADSVGISKSYLSSLELGYRAPNLNILVKIAYSLGVRAGTLVDEMVTESEKFMATTKDNAISESNPQLEKNL